MPNIPTDIEHAISALVIHTRDAERTGSPTAHSLAAVARVSLEAIIASHLRGVAEMKAALAAQTSGA